MKQSFAVMALVMGLTAAKHAQQKFAVGVAADERQGETIKMKEKTLDPFSYIQTGEEPAADAKAAAPAAPKPGPYELKGEKQW
jgi:hypothetical protein